VINANLEERIRKYSAANLEIVAVYVFGSTATGKARKGSDIDVAIMVRGHLDGWARVRLETELSNLTGRDVDLVVFNQATPLLQHQILKNGRLIHESDSRERVRQEVAARADYLDTRFLYKIIDGVGEH
jgi:predicted nucleotidyltransferase